MKKSFLFGALLFASIQLVAQWQVGPKSYLGVIAQGPANLDIMPMGDGHVYNMTFTGSSAVKSLGFMMYNDIGPIFLQTEILGSSYRMDFLIEGYKSMSSGAHLLSNHYYILEIPINAGLMIKDFKLGVGPVVEMKLDVDAGLNAIEAYEDHTRNLDFSFQATAGYRIGIFHVDIKYINKFSSIADGFSIGADVMNFKRSANRFMFGAGVCF